MTFVYYCWRNTLVYTHAGYEWIGIYDLITRGCVFAVSTVLRCRGEALRAQKFLELTIFLQDKRSICLCWYNIIRIISMMNMSLPCWTVTLQFLNNKDDFIHHLWPLHQFSFIVPFFFFSFLQIYIYILSNVWISISNGQVSLLLKLAPFYTVSLQAQMLTCITYLHRTMAMAQSVSIHLFPN